MTLYLTFDVKSPTNSLITVGKKKKAWARSTIFGSFSHLHTAGKDYKAYLKCCPCFEITSKGWIFECQPWNISFVYCTSPKLKSRINSSTIYWVAKLDKLFLGSSCKSKKHNLYTFQLSVISQQLLCHILLVHWPHLHSNSEAQQCLDPLC